MKADLIRLSASDTDEILALLQQTWPALYGATGCPAFGAGFLRWLYGGPDAAHHLLFGARDDAGRLIGFKASLFRSFSGGKSGHIATHLAISPDLALGRRIGLAGNLSELHSLNLYPDSLNLAFFEGGKTLARNTRRAAEKAGWNVREVEFNQFVVNSRRLRSFDGASPTEIRPAEAECSVAVSALLRAQQADLAWTPDAADLDHFRDCAPGALTLTAWDKGRCVGGLFGYELDWMKGGQISTMLICDILAAEDPAVMNVMMRKALDHAEARGLRGIVVESALHLNDQMRQAAGLLKSPRAMTLAVRSAAAGLPEIARFRCDVK